MPGDRLTKVKTEVAPLWQGFQRWRTTSLSGAVFTHSYESVFSAAFFRVSYTILHFLLPGGFWKEWIVVIDGAIITLVFLALGYNVVVEFYNRRQRIGTSNSGSGFLAVVAF
jgi:hypothetical protein